MNGAVVKKTQDTLGKVIKKPPLTEKLLNKPPFRYLHDILSEVRIWVSWLAAVSVEFCPYVSADSLMITDVS